MRNSKFKISTLLRLSTFGRRQSEISHQKVQGEYPSVAARFQVQTRPFHGDWIELQRISYSKHCYGWTKTYPDVPPGRKFEISRESFLAPHLARAAKAPPQLKTWTGACVALMLGWESLCTARLAVRLRRNFRKFRQKNPGEKGRKISSWISK